MKLSINRKIQKNDLFFLLVLFFGACLFVGCMSAFPIRDEAFYSATVMRLINGESLIKNEWHLTQFSSMFQYLPALLFVKINGSADGIIVFMRTLYLLFSLISTTGIYVFFRKKGFFAVVAAAVFLIPPYIFTISYYTIYGIFLMFFSMLLYGFYCKKFLSLYLMAGVCYGVCCICNPLLCCFYPVFVLWGLFGKKIISCLCFLTYKIRKNKKNEENNKASAENNAASVCYEKADLFFSKKAVLYFTAGLSIIAAISIMFYLVTGGGFSSLVINIRQMLSVDEYSAGIFKRISYIYEAFNELSFGLPILLPALFIALIADRKRKAASHRLVYLIAAFVIFTLFFVRILMIKPSAMSLVENKIIAVMMPITMFSHVCYILTQNKNRSLFFCMWLTGLVGAVLMLVTSRAAFTPFGGVLWACAVSGVVLISELFKELGTDIKQYKKDIKGSLINKFSRVLICLALCMQIALHAFLSCSLAFRFYDDVSSEQQSLFRAGKGTLAGIYMDADTFDEYKNTIADLDYIKSISDEDDAVLIHADNPWLYAYLSRPVAAYTTWDEIVSCDKLYEYYEMNPDKVPRYIYIHDSYIEGTVKINQLKRLFVLEKSKLSEGYLLTVKCMG